MKSYNLLCEKSKNDLEKNPDTKLLYIEAPAGYIDANGKRNHSYMLEVTAKGKTKKFYSNGFNEATEFFKAIKSDLKAEGIKATIVCIHQDSYYKPVSIRTFSI